MSILPKPSDTRSETAKAARESYLDLARQMIGEPTIDYTQLYQRFIQNGWSGVKLDDEVSLTALQSGKSPKDKYLTLLQGPYVQHQVYVKDMPKAAMTRYEKATVQEVLNQFREQRQQRIQNRQSQN